MGIPSFARVIIQKYSDTHQLVGKQHVDHFFIDFNCIVYNCYGKLDKTRFKEMNNSKIEKLIINSVVKYLKHLIKRVKPTQSVYIAVDGAAPCAKVHQQRFRRFKTIVTEKLKKEIYKKHNVPLESSWNTSCNIAPGTRFMDKLSKTIEAKIRDGYYSTYTDNQIRFIFSDATVPGEGEHKYMNLLRKMETESPEDAVVVFSPDADVIVLSIASHKNNIKLLRSITDTELTEKLYQGKEFYYLNIDSIRSVFLDEMIPGQAIQDYQTKRIITDYVLLTALAGNDFVVAIPFLKIKLDKMKTTMQLYRKLLEHHQDYLIHEDKSGNYCFNQEFLKDLMLGLANMEDRKMRDIQKSIHRERKRDTMNKRAVDAEDGKSPHEIEITRLEHCPFYSKFNPLYGKYNKEFNKIDFFKPKPEWRHQYYSYFLGHYTSNTVEKVMINYLESLLFVVNYYFNEPPSWRWHYKYRIAPLPSDLHMFLETTPDINKLIKFTKGEPLRPLEQLMIILPPQMAHIMPKACHNLMTSTRSKLKKQYPRDVELDVYPGQKLIYTEPLLPEMDIDKLVTEFAKIEDKLVPLERDRNINRDKPVEIIN